MSRDMRSILVRCLVVLLAFALIGGNAHARLHLTPPEQPATHTHHHHGHAGQSEQHKPDQHKGIRCCCDCLGCVSAFNLTPDPVSIVTVFGTSVRFPERAVVLQGRVLLPDPKPPRPIALS